MNKIIAFIVLVGVFFFSEIALTFSDRGQAASIEEESASFSLSLNNQLSDFEASSSLDKQLSDFMQKWEIEGATVAVTLDEKLVYARGYGTADVSTGEQVQPGHLFRIASVSKLITAVAIMKLNEQGVLELDEKVFGPDAILHDSIYRNYKDRRFERISVRHLLNHTGGWSERNPDPLLSPVTVSRRMKRPLPLTAEDVIEYSLGRRLNYTPGSRFAYSNLGYAILGEIIEARSGMSYEDFVQQHVLLPINIRDMHLGKSYYHEKYSNEVAYYSSGGEILSRDSKGSGKMVPVYYGGNNMELLGPAGGWVASAPELMKFLTAIDGRSIRSDILDASTILAMTNPKMAGKGLFGWRGSNAYGTWWRTGYLTGSTSMLARQNNGISWVIITNTSTSKHSKIQRDISGLMFEAVNGVDEWPAQDLFYLNL